MIKPEKKQKRSLNKNQISKKQLVGDFTTFEKYAPQNGFIFPKIRGDK